MIENTYYAQDNHGPYERYDLGDFALAEGGTVRGCQLAYATFGALNDAKDNAILVPTWYSGTSKIMEDVYIGPDHALNPDEYFIIVVNQIGNGLSSSPHNTPFPDGRANFPHVRIEDDVRAQRQFITDHFGIERLALVVGGSMGAQQTYEWAVRFPDMVARAAPIAGTAKNTDHDFLFTQTLMDAITSDPGWNDGWYESNTEVYDGLRRHAEIWAMMGWSTEFYKQERWRDLGFASMQDFLTGFMFGYFGVMDPNNLLCMAWKWQRGDVSRSTNGDLKAALGRVTAKMFVMPIDEDMFFPPRDCEPEQQMVPDSELRVIHTIDGHLGLFGTDPDYIGQVDEHLHDLLSTPVDA